MRKLPKDMPYIKTVKAKGKVYEYFDAGKNVRGERIYKRLPPRSDKSFGGVYAAFLAHKTAVKNLKPLATINDLSREYQRNGKFTKRSGGTQTTYLIYLRQIEAKLGMAPVDRVERRDVMKLLADMQDRPSAANMVLLILKQMFRIALNLEWVKVDPTATIKGMETEDEDHEPWDEDLIATALEDAEMRLPVALLYYTGQRIGDVCKMRWADVQSDGTIYVCQEKTKAEIYVPIHSDLRAILETQPRAAETILTGFRGKPPRRQTLRLHLQQWARERGAQIVPHGLRKNAVNTLLEVGCTVAEVASITAQSMKTVEHYAKRRNNRKIAHRAMQRWDGTNSEDRKGLENHSKKDV